MNTSRYIGQLVEVQVDRPLGSSHPKYGFRYPVNYGFIPGTLSPDGEELDAYVLGISEPLTTYFGRCVAVIHRLDEDDDKLVVVPDGANFPDSDIRQLTQFQEQFFTSDILRE